MKKIKKVRRRYDEVFKKEAVNLISENRSAASVAESLGIDRSMLYQWRKQFKEKGNVVDMVDDETTRLRRRVLELEEERYILKKALSILSRQT